MKPPPLSDPLAHALYLDRCSWDIEFLYDAVGLKDEFGDMPEHLIGFQDKVIECEEAGEAVQIIAPKGCLKSTGLKLESIQDLLKSSPGLLFGSSSPKVKDFTSDWIRNKIKFLMGGEGRPWTLDSFNVPNHNQTLMFPSYVAITCGDYVEGIKLLKWKGDDLIDFRSTYSEIERDRAKEWYVVVAENRTVDGAPAADRGSFFHHNDLYVFNIKRGIRTEIYPMFGCEPPAQWAKYPWVHHHGGEYEVLWKEKYGGITPEEYRIRKKLSPGMFQLLVQCDPWGTENMRFRPDKIQLFDEVPPAGRQRASVWVGDDPAASEVEIKKNAESGLVVLVYDPVAEFTFKDDDDKIYKDNGIIYVVDAMGFQGTLEKSRNICLAVHERWKPNPWVIERSTASIRYIEYIRTHTPLHLYRDQDRRYGQKPGGPKASRIDSLVPHIESGKIRIQRNLDKLIGQLTEFPGGDKDDLADALEVGCRQILAGKGVTSEPVFGRRTVDY